MTGIRVTDVLGTRVGEAANPLLPAWWEVAVTVGGLLHLGLLIGLVIWLLMMRGLTPLERLVGLLVGIVLPIAGPVLVWVILGSAARRETAPGRL